MYDFIVIIGRFQPFHLGHQDMLSQAFEKGRHVIMLCGSANSPRSLRNPWTVTEREDMIRSSLSEERRDRLIVRGLNDHTYDDVSWINEVMRTVSDEVRERGGSSICLMGHYKDNSSYYLMLFEGWDLINIELNLKVDATEVRKHFFEGSPTSVKLMRLLPSTTTLFMVKFHGSEEKARLTAEYESVQKYKKSWEDSPYAPTFVTVDAIVVHRGRVLMIKRKDFPGKGLLALPGGFVNPDETLIDACVRELKEETCIDVGHDDLKAFIWGQKTYDDPNRSSIGRTFTHAFLFNINLAPMKPRTKASDDAEEVYWLDIKSLDPRTIHEDHYHIIKDIIKGENND